MPRTRAPSTKKATTLTVAVKCRKLVDRDRGRDIIRVSNDKEVLVLDPDLSKDYLDRVQNRTKERRYSFDYAFGPESKNSDVYNRSISSTVAGVIQGLNATIFAYGSTGSGKTYTMVGTQDDPGLMVLSLHTIFGVIKKENTSNDIDVTCSYLEVYNEVIYDLLEKASGHLELREDPQHGIVVAGLRCIKVNSTDKILELLNMGNSRRKTESTGVNYTSSRSHAVLEITVTKKQKNIYRNQVIRGKLALVDLAGSERASETNSGGQMLRDGANINRSLLALANCINALGKQQKKGLAYVPYRNSKLTRILKDGLSGNSQTIMIATISPADIQYHHTVNTLKYADRAKEIKTHIQKNIGTINTHVSDYQKMIHSLQVEVGRLKKELAEKESRLTAKPTEKPSDDELSWFKVLSQETSENVQERINLQKALYELDEINLRNHTELQHLDDTIAKQKAAENGGAVLQALVSRQQVILDNIRENDEADANYKREIEANEKRRCQLQEMIEEAMSKNSNKTYLRILSQYRLLGMVNTELQFEMAMRDQIIYNQQEAQRNMWNLLIGLGLDEKQISEIAAKQAISIEDSMVTSHLVLADGKQSTNAGSYIPLPFSPRSAQSFSKSSRLFKQNQDSGATSFSMGNQNMPHTFCREEHHSSYYYMSNDNYPSALMRMVNNNHRSLSDGIHSGFSASDKYTHGLHDAHQQMKTLSSSYSGSSTTASSFSSHFQQHQQESWTSSIARQPHESYSPGISQDPVCTEHQSWSSQDRFGCSLAEQDHAMLRPGYFSPNSVPSNRQNMSPILPSYGSSSSIPLNKCSLDAHP